MTRVTCGQQACPVEFGLDPATLNGPEPYADKQEAGRFAFCGFHLQLLSMSRRLTDHQKGYRMRRWGGIVSTFYGVLVLVFLVPSAVLFAGGKELLSHEFYDQVIEIYKQVWTWIPIAAVLIGQAMLFFLSVDTAYKRLKPRTHVLVTSAVTAMLMGLLTVAGLFSVGVAVYGDKFLDRAPDSFVELIGLWAILWAVWGVFFYVYLRGSSQYMDRAVSWLLRGSVLELLITAPCHVMVRQRHDITAPVATGFGIATGIAVMLLSFGPGMLLLYKKRLDSYSEYRSRKPQLVAK